MIRRMSDEVLLRAYGDSLKHSLDREFVEMLERELRRRGKIGAIAGAGRAAEPEEASDG